MTCNLIPAYDHYRYALGCGCGHARYQHALFSWGTICFECGRKSGTGELAPEGIAWKRLPCTCETFGNGVVSGNDGRLSPDGGCPRHGRDES